MAVEELVRDNKSPDVILKYLERAIDKKWRLVELLCRWEDLSLFLVLFFFVVVVLFFPLHKILDQCR